MYVILQSSSASLNNDDELVGFSVSLKKKLENRIIFSKFQK